MRQTAKNNVLSGQQLYASDGGRLAEYATQVTEHPEVFNRRIRVAGVDEAGNPVLLHSGQYTIGATVVIA